MIETISKEKNFRTLDFFLIFQQLALRQELDQRRGRDRELIRTGHD